MRQSAEMKQLEADERTRDERRGVQENGLTPGDQVLIKQKKGKKSGQPPLQMSRTVQGYQQNNTAPKSQ